MASKLKKGVCYLLGIFLPGISIGGCYPFVSAYIASMWMLDLDKRILAVCMCAGIVLFLPLVEGVKYLLIFVVCAILLTLTFHLRKKCSAFLSAFICALVVTGIGIAGELFVAENEYGIIRCILEGVFTMTITIPSTIWLNRFLKVRHKMEKTVEAYRIPEPEQLSNYAKSFSNLSKVLGQKLDRRPYPYSWEREQIRQEIVEAVCDRCEASEGCGLKNGEQLDSFLFPLFLPGKEMDVDEEEKRVYFQENCLRATRMEEEVLHIFERAKLNLSWYNRLLENREMIAEQLNVMADLMEGYSKDYKDITEHEKKRVADLQLGLKELGVTLLDCTICERKNHHWEIVLNVKASANRSIRTKDICEVVENCMDRDLQQTIEEKVFVTEEAAKLILEDIPQYYMMQGIAKMTKEGENISGDNFSVLTVEGGRAAICLSDGMGSGQDAFSESTTTVEMMESFLQAGLEPEMAIQMMNSAMVLYSKEDMFSTLDLCVGDLHSGNFRFYKVGAAASFLKHDKYVEVVSAVGLPAGTFYKTEVAEKRKKLSNGEYIVMMTDGLLDFLPAEEPLEWMQDCISRIQVTKPARMAEEILENALEAIGGVPKDDMTVCVCGLWENK